MVATSTPTGLGGSDDTGADAAMTCTTRPRRSSRLIAEPSAQTASNCGSGIGLDQRPVVRMLYPALFAFRKSISAQMSPLGSVPPNAGIAGAPDGASMPCETYQNKSPSVCPQKCAAVRSAGGSGSDFAIGPSPLASAP